MKEMISGAYSGIYPGGMATFFFFPRGDSVPVGAENP